MSGSEQTNFYSLRNQVCFSSLDLANAYMSFEITDESKPLTRFLTPIGEFRFNVIPTGMANSPAIFAKVAYKMIHKKVLKDENGNIIFEKPGVAKMKEAFLPNVHQFFDDLLIASPVLGSYKETIDFHYKLLEEVVSRLADHEAKPSEHISEF